MENIAIYPGAILELQTTLMHLKKLKVFLVTGKKSFESCGAKEKLQWLFDTYEVTHFNDFQTNPDSKDVINGVQLFNHAKSEIIVSVGGGSVIDMAKLINYYHNAGINRLTESNINISDPKLVPHICLPTTAGSGAEATHFAVMYVSINKYSIAHPNLIPDKVIIDTELLYSQTQYQKAISGVDALSQSIESLWSINSTDESRYYSERALELIWKNLPSVVHNGEKLAFINLAVGANLAGRAINIAKTTAPHALSYGFTKYAGLPHGHAVALTLPFFLKKNINITADNCNDTRGILHVLKQLEIISILTNSNVQELDSTLRSFFESINLNINFIQLDISREVFNRALSFINLERLANNPVKIYLNELISIYE